MFSICSVPSNSAQIIFCPYVEGSCVHSFGSHVQNMSEILLLVAHFYSTIVQSGQKKVLHTSQCTNIYPQSNHCKHDRTLPFQNAIFIEVSVRIFHHLRSGVRWSKTKLFCCFIFCC